MTGATLDNHEVWVGVLVVFPRVACEMLDADKGAYVNVLTWANSDSEYRLKALPVMEHYGLEVAEVTNVQPLHARLAEPDIKEDLVDELLEIADQISSEKHVIYGNFYTFPRRM